MPFYEFECPRGHVTEKLVPIGTPHVVCETCVPTGRHRFIPEAHLAHRILSPTPTTFVAAGGRKL